MGEEYWAGLERLPMELLVRLFLLQPAQER